MSTYVTKMAKEKNLKVVDAAAPLELEVSGRDISLAEQKNSKCCAFARAAKRQHECKGAYFFRTAAWLEYAKKIVRYVLPPSMQKEIVSFDRAGVMTPGIYQMSKPSGSQRMHAVRKRSAKRPGRHQPGNGTIKRRVVHQTQLVRNLAEPAEL